MTTRGEPKLVGLARNPAVTEDVLVRLARNAVAAHEMSCRRGRLPDAVVIEILAHRNPSSVLNLDGRRASPGMRARIAADPDPAIRDARINFVRSMIERAVFLPIEHLEEAFGRPRLTLAADSDPRVRAAVADAWWDRPADVHTALLTDPEPAVRAAASRRRALPVPVKLQAACLADPATRAYVASYVDLTPELAIALATDPDDEVRQAVAQNPTLPADAVVLLIADPHPFVRSNIVLHRLVDGDTRDRLYAQLAAEAQAGSVDAQVGLEWNFLEPDWVCEEPLSARLVYLESRHVAFRRALARSRDLPAEAWQRLDHDADWRVRRYAAMRPDVPAAVLERLVRDHGDDGPFRPGLVDHPNFPRDALRGFADEPDPRVRCLTLKDPTLPRHLLARLAADADGHVRRATAGHPGLDETLFAVLLADADADVVADAAANASLPAAWMYRIVDDAHL